MVFFSTTTSLLITGTGSLFCVARITDALLFVPARPPVLCNNVCANEDTVDPTARATCVAVFTTNTLPLYVLIRATLVAFATGSTT